LLIIHSTRLSPKKKKASVEEKGNCELLTEDFRNWIQKLDFLPWIGIKTKFTDGCFAFRRVEEERERKKLKKNNTLIVEKKNQNDLRVGNETIKVIYFRNWLVTAIKRC